MNKAIGVLVIGLGLIMIVIGITGTQSKVLADLKAVNPSLRANLGSGAGGNSPAQNAANATTTPGLAPVTSAQANAPKSSSNPAQGFLSGLRSLIP